MPSTKLAGCHPVTTIGRDARTALDAAKRAALPPAELAADWLVKRHRVRPNLAATVAGLAGVGGR